MSDIPPPDGTDTEGDDRLDNIEPIEIQAGDGGLLPPIRHVGHHRPGPARCPGRTEAGAPRILWSMFDSGHRPDRSHVKCATVVGDVIGRFHPHGDSAIYDALVRMGQDFSLRHTLIDPHGNFGSPDDPPAAYRYTECRLTPLAMRLLADIDEDTSTSGRTSTASTTSRWCCLPGSRICWSMAARASPWAWPRTSRPTTWARRSTPPYTSSTTPRPPRRPHGVRQGPDFPPRPRSLGAWVSAMPTGRGEARSGCGPWPRSWRTNGGVIRSWSPRCPIRPRLIRSLARPPSWWSGRPHRATGDPERVAKGKTRLVFELRRDATALVVLNNLYKYTPMQTTFSVNMVALVDEVPRTLNLRDLLVAYVEHQREVIRRRSEYRLQRAPGSGPHRGGPAPCARHDRMRSSPPSGRRRIGARLASG